MPDQMLLDTALKKIDYTFRWIGINIESCRKTKSQNFRYKLVFIFNFIWMNMDFFGAIAWFIVNARKGASFTKLTYIAPCLAMCVLSNTKSCSLYASDNRINELLNILRNLEIKHHDFTVPEKKELIKNDYNLLFLVLKTVNFFNWFLLIAFPFMPFTLMALEYYHTKEVVLMLPFQVVYPFDAYNIKYWPYAYLRQVWGTVVVIIGLSGVDYFFFICVSCMCVQFNLLYIDINNLGCDGGSIVRTSEELHRRIVALVKWHQMLIHSVHLLEVIYSKSILVNFLCSSVLICLCGFNIMTVDDKPLIISFGSFLFMSLFQILSLCYFGDMLMRSSAKVSEAVYNSYWYTMKANIGKELTIIQMRAQNPSKLTAYSFADVNLLAFTRILSTSWSYFALLRTMYSSPRV